MIWCKPRADLAGLHLQHLRHAFHLRILLLHPLQRAVGGHRLDPADAGRDRRLRHDLEEADVAGAPHMRAAAQLGGEIAHADDAHFVAVFLAEQRHRTGLDRLVVLHQPRLDRDVAADLLVDQPLDLADLLRRSAAVSCEKSKRVFHGSTSEPFCCT